MRKVVGSGCALSFDMHPVNKEKMSKRDANLCSDEPSFCSKVSPIDVVNRRTFGSMSSRYLGTSKYTTTSVFYPPVLQLYRGVDGSLLSNGSNQSESNTRMFHRRGCVGSVVGLDASFGTGKGTTFDRACIQRGDMNFIADWIRRFIRLKLSKSLPDPLVKIALSIKDSESIGFFSSNRMWLYIGVTVKPGSFL